MLRMCGFSNSPKQSKMHKLSHISFIVKILSVAKTIYSTLIFSCSESYVFYVKNPILFLLQLSTTTFFYNSKYAYFSSNHMDRSILVHTMGSIFFSLMWGVQTIFLGVYNPIKITTISVYGLITCTKDISMYCHLIYSFFALVVTKTS